MEVVAEALTWLGTKFAMNAAIKGVAVDCGRYPELVYRSAGLDVPNLPAHWPRDFMCHAIADTEPYLTLIQKKLVEVSAPLPGDLAIFKPFRSRCFSHTAIVVDWPKVIHARGVGMNAGVEECAYGQWPLDGGIPVRFFSPFSKF